MITELDVSPKLITDEKEARRKWEQSYDWRDARRVFALVAGPVWNNYGRPNGIGTAPFGVTCPNLDVGALALANQRWLLENLLHRHARLDWSRGRAN